MKTIAFDIIILFFNSFIVAISILLLLFILPFDWWWVALMISLVIRVLRIVFERPDFLGKKIDEENHLQEMWGTGDQDQQV